MQPARLTRISILGFALLAGSCSRTVKQQQTAIVSQPPSAPRIERQLSDQMTRVIKSAVDGHEFVASIHQPGRGSPAGVALCLGEPDDFPELLGGDNPYWRIVIPSRAGMNYSLIAETDFWHAYKTLADEFSELSDLPHYIIGAPKQTNAALRFANDYRARVSGVIITGAPLRLRYPNLDSLPIVALDPSARHLIRRLERRGNDQTAMISGQPLEALQLLRHRQMQPKELSPYTFYNDLYSQAYPWLKVVARHSSEEPATVRAFKEKSTLVIEGTNLAAVEIDRARAFLQDFDEIRYQGRSTSLKDRDQTPLTLGTILPPKGFRRKVDTPSTYGNFFTDGPVYIVVQDGDVGQRYGELAYAFAETLSGLRLKGFPRLGVKIPVVPLSQYDATALEPHRAIFIGLPTTLRSIVEDTRGYLPERALPDVGTRRAFGLIYPPQEQSPLKLAMLLAAEDPAGLEALKQHYSTATALFDTSDREVWLFDGFGYHRQSSLSFDSYWGEGDHPTVALTLPPQQAQTWEYFLQEILLQEGQTTSWLLAPLVDQKQATPAVLTYRSLTQWIPEREFARVTLRGEAGARILQSWLADSSLSEVQGLEHLIDRETGELETRRMRRQSKDVIVDLRLLEKLTSEELQIISYEPLGKSLHEMVWDRLRSNQQDFAKELLRQGTPLYR